MDLMYFIIIWLKSFLGRMRSITSFVSKSYLPTQKQEEEDDYDFFRPFREG